MIYTFYIQNENEKGIEDCTKGKIYVTIILNFLKMNYSQYC